MTPKHPVVFWITVALGGIVVSLGLLTVATAAVMDESNGARILIAILGLSVMFGGWHLIEVRRA